MIITALVITACGLWIGAAMARLARRITKNAYHALFATGFAVNLIASVMDRSVCGAPVSAAGLALSLWFWWNGGGGDGTKRRLKKWVATFKGVRRTAPVGTS